MSPAILLAAWLTVSGQTPEAAEPAPEPAPEVAPSSIAGGWPGEERRFHWGAGARYHFGVMVQLGSPQLLSEGGLFGLLSIRTFGHQEFRVQLELDAGIPDLFGGESQISYRFYLRQWLSVGGALVFYIGAPSFRAGVEVPVAVRLGSRRQHEIGVALRFTGGVFNNSTFVWWDLGRQRPAITAELTAGYTYIF